MPHNRLTHPIRLIFLCTIFQQNLSRDNRALELEAHLCRCKEGIGCTDIMEKTRQIVRFRVVCCCPRRKMCAYERSPVYVYAVTVVEGWFVQLVLHDTSYYGSRQDRKSWSGIDPP